MTPIHEKISSRVFKNTLPTSNAKKWKKSLTNSTTVTNYSNKGWLMWSLNIKYIDYFDVQIGAILRPHDSVPNTRVGTIRSVVIPGSPGTAGSPRRSGYTSARYS